MKRLEEKLKREHQEQTSILQSKAGRIVQDVDSWYLLRHHRNREYPTFDPEEVILGPLLGVGGFGDVYEVKEFKLKPDNDRINSLHPFDPSPSTSTKHQVDGQQQLTGESAAGQNSEGEVIPDPVARPPLAKEDKDEHHYEVASARKYMAESVMRNGDARYAIKRLGRNLDAYNTLRGMIDIAIEAKCMSALWHPNLVKMRGVASTPLLSNEFFIVMDRLYTRLDHRLDEWKETYKQHKGGLFGRNKNKDAIKTLMVDRMVVCYDLSSALTYMHAHKLVYRDIKQENIAFDVRGDVKIFDFGLCKSLSPKLRARDKLGGAAYGYNLTPRTGSLPYLSPENVEGKPYDCKTDVFSLSILISEILTLKRAYPPFTKREYMDKVVRAKLRPKLDKEIPSLTSIMLREAWDHNPEKRPDMSRVSVMLRGDLNDMTTDDRVKNRTQHLASRTRHSMRINHHQQYDGGSSNLNSSSTEWK